MAILGGYNACPRLETLVLKITPCPAVGLGLNSRTTDEDPLCGQCLVSLRCLVWAETTSQVPVSETLLLRLAVAAGCLP